MTNQEKIKYLRRYRDNEREIQRLQDEILRWDSLSRKVTTSFGGIGGSNREDRLQVAIEKIVELQNQLTRQVITRISLREDIEQIIGSVEDERLQQLLRYRYIDGWTWERIAVALDMSYQWICRLHGEALSKIIIS